MKGHLATIFPPLSRISLPVSRDQAYLLFIILNQAVLGLETYLAHSLNGSIRWREWIPIWYGPLACILLVTAFVLAKRRPRLSRGLALFALAGSIVVGVLGTTFHFVRAIRPQAPLGERLSLELLVWGPSVIAPPAFVLVGVLGLVALCSEQGRDAGALGQTTCQIRFLSKDRLYFFLASLGVLIAAVSSALDHMRGGFENPWLWVPTLSGVFGVAVALTLGLMPRHGRADLTVYALSMGLLLAVGPLGLLLHVLHNLGAGQAIVLERFLRGAPTLAPLVFANQGLLGLLALLDPVAGE